MQDHEAEGIPASKTEPLGSGSGCRLCRPYSHHHALTCYSFYFYICETAALGAGKTTQPEPRRGGEAAGSGGGSRVTARWRLNEPV